MKRYQAAIFDLDGTLLDTLGDLTDSMNTILEKYGLPPCSEQMAAETLGNGSAVFLEKASGGKWQGRIFEERLDEYKKWYETHMDRKTKPFSGCLSMLEEVRKCGMKCAVVSNKFDEAVKVLCRQHFENRLDDAIGEGNGLRPKPAPDMLLAAAEKLGVSIEDCVFVGDTEVDLMTARGAGMDCICVNWGFRKISWLKEHGAERIAESMEELTEMICKEREE